MFLGAKSFPTCVNYALKGVGLDDEEEYPIATNEKQDNFYMDDFIKLVETPEEAIEAFSQLNNFSHNTDMNRISGLAIAMRLLKQPLKT